MCNFDVQRVSLPFSKHPKYFLSFDYWKDSYFKAAKHLHWYRWQLSKIFMLVNLILIVPTNYPQCPLRYNSLNFITAKTLNIANCLFCLLNIFCSFAKTKFLSFSIAPYLYPSFHVAKEFIHWVHLLLVDFFLMVAILNASLCLVVWIQQVARKSSWK